ncbi:MAG: FMN-binding protein [Clostridia bacterium]|nr:FMN-binding protein [Clostridia bacterium]
MSNTKKKDSLKSIIVLLSICLLVAVLLAAVNMLTKDTIKEADEKKEADALKSVIDGAEEFEELNPVGCDESVVAVYKEKEGRGYAVLLSVKGYDSSNPMSVAVGFDNEGKITKCHVISCSGETSGIGTKVSDDAFLSSFEGKNDMSSVDTISGATISSSAFVEAVDSALKAVELVKEAE